MSGLPPGIQTPSRLTVLSTPPRKLTSRIFGHVRLGTLLAIVLLEVVGLSSRVLANTPPSPGAGIGTPLPPGWELCVLQGVGAAGTADNVANLDEWQVAEGGSTNNTAAYNPFNTRQVTDSTGAPLPVVISSDGFPAFATWAAGCSATVATLLQPSMAPIVDALIAGAVSPPGIFLSDVDQSPWCAPSADGIPCYATEILGGELLESLFGGGSGQLKDALTELFGYRYRLAVVSGGRRIDRSRSGPPRRQESTAGRGRA